MSQKPNRELKALLIDNETLPTLSSIEGNNIAERLRYRRRGNKRKRNEFLGSEALLIDNEAFPTLSSIKGNNIAERLRYRRRGNQDELKQTELESPFVIPEQKVSKKSRRGKRKRNEFLESETLLIDNEALPTLSSIKGNNIAERLRYRRRGNQAEIKQTELENPFVIPEQKVPKKSRRGKRKRNEFLERLEENESQVMQQEQEIATEESTSVWEPWDEVTPTKHIRRLKGNIVNVVIEPKNVSKPSTRKKKRRIQDSKETQEEGKELDAMANGSKVPRMMTPERAAGSLKTEEISLRTPEPVLSSALALQQIKRGPKKVDYDIADLTTLIGPSQPVPVVEQGILARSERLFEDNVAQQRRSRIRKTPAEMSSSVEAFSSFTEMKQVKEHQNLDHLITRYFNKWENELNTNKNVLLYGFGSKEYILETYQAFDNKNENITWVHFDGNGDLSTMNDAYLMMLDRIIGPNHTFRNHTLIGKALAIRDYYTDIFSRIKFKIIVHNIDGYVFQSIDARYALNLLGSIPNIHLLATGESINSCLGWYVNAEDRMNWHVHEITSLSNYKLAVSSNSQDYRLKRKELKSVLASWNTYRRAMFATLADYIVTATRRGETNGDSLDFNTLFKYCVENLICRDEKTFRRYLEDFYYHGVFLAKKIPSGEVRITIPISLHDLEAFLLDKDIFGDL